MEKLIEAAKDLYIFAFPLVLTEVTHWGYSCERFEHFREFPKINDKRVTKLNYDTLYSFAWTQLANTPYVIHIPEITERYYLFPIYDPYSNVIESIGTRTPERSAGDYLLLYQNQDVPEGYEKYTIIRCENSLNGILLRIETRGESDYTAVHKIQDSITFHPLFPEKLENVPAQKDIYAVEYVENLPAKKYFELFAKLSVLNPIKDIDIIKKFVLFGYNAKNGEFHYDNLSEEYKKSLCRGRELALELTKIPKYQNEDIYHSNGWNIMTGGIGEYGSRYLERAATNRSGWGGNIAKDSAYATTYTDSEGIPFSNKKDYKIHINADEFPHAAVFWSLTLYGEPSRLPVDNVINRYAINSHNIKDKTIALNEDGSLDIYISKKEPKDSLQRQNWLPAPKDEEHFSVSIRIYYPDEDTLNGKWAAPKISML